MSAFPEELKDYRYGIFFYPYNPISSTAYPPLKFIHIFNRYDDDTILCQIFDRFSNCWMEWRTQDRAYVYLPGSDLRIFEIVKMAI